MKKNVASQIVQCQVTTAADGTPFTGSVTVSVTGDGGTRATGSVGSGAATHEGGGLHSYAPAQAETNYDFVSFQFAGTGAITSAVHFTTGYPQTADVASGVAVNSIAANAITAAATAADFTTEVTSGLATAANVTTSTSTITALLPAALVGGRMDASVGAMAANSVTASALASDAVTEIQSGLATAASVAALPTAATISDAVWDEAIAGHVGSGSTGEALGGASAPSAATVAAAVWSATSGYGGQDYQTLTSNIMTAADDASTVANRVEVDTQDIQARIPAALVSGRMDSSVGAMAANAVTASSLATDAVAEIVTAVWAAVSEAAETYGDQLRLVVAALAGKATVQDDDGSYAFRDQADSKDRIAGSRSTTARTVTTRDGT